MNTPDHLPYLREGDLRTAEDVLAWLTRYLDAPGGTGTMAPHDLRARLDRERRQACRRGPLKAWRSFANGAEHGHTDCEYCERDLALALAFRAAARAR